MLGDIYETAKEAETDVYIKMRNGGAPHEVAEEVSIIVREFYRPVLNTDGE